MASPMNWNDFNSQKPRFNQEFLPQMTKHQPQNMQRFDMRIPPPGIRQGFNCQFNPAYNINSTLPPSTQRFSRAPGTNYNPVSSFVPSGNQDMTRMQAPGGSWDGSTSHMHNSRSSFPPPTQGSFHGWNEQQRIIQNTAENSNYDFHQPNVEKQIEIHSDEVWVKNWCDQREKHMEQITQKPKKSLKICTTQDKTRQMIVLLARLQKNRQMLETLKDEDKSIWDQKLKEVRTMKSELECLQEEVMSDENLKQLKKRVDRRKKKRERIKQRRHILHQEKIKQFEDREIKHAEIDKAMQQIMRKQAVEKQEKDMQKEADEILSQVRKKQIEANKYLQIVSSLLKLRKLRTNRLERQGMLSMYESRGNTAAGKLMFEAKMENISQLLNSQLEIYKHEEAALRVHLETEHEETREKEREKSRLQMIERQKQNIKKEEQMLFGVERDPVPGDPMFPFRQYYDSASYDLNSLVSIRRDWDHYLSLPGTGSRIPDDWVIPTDPSSDTWASVIK